MHGSTGKCSAATSPSSRTMLIARFRPSGTYKQQRHEKHLQYAAQAPATACTSGSSSSGSSSGDLVEWMQQQGCTISGVALFYEHQRSGAVTRELRATKDLSPGEEVLSVPLACTIHYIEGQQQQQQQQPSSTHDGETAASSSSDDSSSDSSRRSALRRLQCNVPAASDSGRGAWQFKLALEILYHHHQGADSPLQPYIQSLPGAYPGIPGPQVAMLYPEPQLQELQYAPLIADAGSQIYWWRQYSRDVLAVLPGSADDPFGGKLVTEEQLGWALSVAMSRAFAFKLLGGWALVPLVDMANHNATSNAEIRFDADGGRVRMIANKQVAAGSAIYLRYGAHDNSNLLLSYGFVLADNPADSFSCPLDIDLLLAAIYQFVGGELPPGGRAVDGLKQWQRTTLQQLGLLSSSPSNSSSSRTPAAPAAAAAEHGSSATQQQHVVSAATAPLMVRIGGDPPVSAALLAAVRVALATDRASVKGKSLEQLGDWQQPLSPAHEAVVLKALVGFVTILYKSFPTSIQADKALLEELQQQSITKPFNAVAGPTGHAAASGASCDELAVERLHTAVQFRLGMKQLLERSTMALIVRLKELQQQQ